MTSRFYYGWVMAGVCTVALIATSPGQTVVVSQFNLALRESLDLSSTELSAAYMIGTLVAAVPLVLIGRLSDRYGPRLMLGLVGLCFGCACMLAGLAQGVVSLTVVFFLLRFLGQGSLSLISGHALALWFHRRLATVNAGKIIVTQVANLVIPAAALLLIHEGGWRYAYVILGLGVLVATLPLAAFVARDHPDEVGQHLDGDTPDPQRPAEADVAFTLHETVRTFAYWTLVAVMVLPATIGTAYMFHAQAILEVNGLDPNQSVNMARAWSTTMMVMLLPAGVLADRCHPRVLCLTSVVLLTVSCVLMMMVTTVWAAMVAMTCFGVAQTAAVAVGVPTVARYFGRAHHGAIRGSMTRITVAGTGLGPLLLGASLDLFGTFTPGHLLFILLCVRAIAAPATLRPPTRASTSRERSP
ncbi:MAG: MFS transporter [Phycisphaerales bacterium]|nr:MFS transporter [Phycisphaerales bacterium]